MFALVDCHNFFVSCERVFRPDLQKRPVAVLSSNDGCIIARSKEVKEMGIPMGVPIFKVKNIIKKYNVKLFSSNFTLYGDMSRRIMTSLTHYTQSIEIYSIDEAFLDCSKLGPDWDSLGQMIIKDINTWTGIPIGIGFGPTKTLAKIANFVAKKRHDSLYVLDIPDKIDETLKNIKVEDIWGVGYNLAPKLRARGIYTAFDLKQTNPKWIRKLFSVVAERMVHELNGISCLSIDEVSDSKKSIQVTRSFGKDVTSFDELREAVSTYAMRLAEKLRKNNSHTNMVGLYIRTSPFRSDFFKASTIIGLNYPTNDTITLIKAVAVGLKQIFKEGYSYKKAGIFACNLSLITDAIQQKLFIGKPYKDNPKLQNLNNTLDTINKRYRARVVMPASCGIQPSWLVQCNNRSPAYTTRWEEIPVVH